jgi:hypothetical protein
MSYLDHVEAIADLTSPTAEIRVRYVKALDYLKAHIPENDRERMLEELTIADPLIGFEWVDFAVSANPKSKTDFLLACRLADDASFHQEDSPSDTQPAPQP